jgi:hypothetical protein
MLFEHSRYTFCEAWFDGDGRIFLDARKPFRYRAYPDNLIHVVQQGETLWNLAGRHFRPHTRAAGLWWVIADFQPNPISDPTIALVPGSSIVLPSLQTVTLGVFSERRRGESRF